MVNEDRLTEDLKKDDIETGSHHLETTARDGFDVLNQKKDLPEKYEDIVMNLRNAFGDKIPENLDDKSINIRYKDESHIYHNLRLDSDGIYLPGKKSLGIHKNNEGLWRTRATKSNKVNVYKGIVKTEPERVPFNFKEFDERIKDIINHADICECEISDNSFFRACNQLINSKRKKLA